MTKRILTTILAGTMAVSTSVTAFAGWEQEGANWKYNDNGIYAANGWQWIDDDGDGIAERYYFDANGYMLANTAAPDGYIVNADGAWTIAGKIQLKTVNTTDIESITYTDDINDTVWDLMNHTRQENDQKYGAERISECYPGQPYSTCYMRDNLHPFVDELGTEKPYFVGMYSTEAPLTLIFKNAPDPQGLDQDSLAEKLTEMGYQVKKGRTNAMGKVCIIEIGSCELYLSYYNGVGELRFCQEMDEKTAEGLGKLWNLPRGIAY